MTDLSVAASRFCSRTRDAVVAGDAELADQRCGEGDPARRSRPGGDLAYRQAALQQQFVGLVQASAARVVHGRLSGSRRGTGCGKRAHRKIGQPRQVGYL